MHCILWRSFVSVVCCPCVDFICGMGVDQTEVALTASLRMWLTLEWGTQPKYWPFFTGLSENQIPLKSLSPSKITCDFCKSLKLLLNFLTKEVSLNNWVGQSTSEDFIPHHCCAVPGICPKAPAPSCCHPCTGFTFGF